MIVESDLLNFPITTHSLVRANSTTTRLLTALHLGSGYRRLIGICFTGGFLLQNQNQIHLDVVDLLERFANIGLLLDASEVYSGMVNNQ
jgi:putative copper export protein